MAERTLQTLVRIETEQEDDGRWIAEAPDYPGAMAYGSTEVEAERAAHTLALRVITERAEREALIAALVEGENSGEPVDGEDAFRRVSAKLGLSPLS